MVYSLEYKIYQDPLQSVGGIVVTVLYHGGEEGIEEVHIDVCTLYRYV